MRVYKNRRLDMHRLCLWRPVFTLDFAFAQNCTFSSFVHFFVFPLCVGLWTDWQRLVTVKGAVLFLKARDGDGEAED